MPADPFEQRERDVARGHRVGVRKRDASLGLEQRGQVVDRRVGVETTGFDRHERLQLLVGHSLLAANCSVDVLSEHTPDE